MFRKILIPLDGSQLAEKILPDVGELAKLHKAQVTLLTVGDSSTAMPVGLATPSVIKEAALEQRKTAQQCLDDMSRSLGDSGVKADWIYKEAVPAREIVATADENAVDLIAMATHGRGDIAWALGSVAERVVTHANRPVLLYRITELKQPIIRTKAEFVAHPYVTEEPFAPLTLHRRRGHASPTGAKGASALRGGKRP
jgi:nucleotide-binding universal stress UspA family protein